MEKRKKSLLIGLCLGDGHLSTNSGTALLIEHGHKQLFYLEYKAKLIAKLLNCKDLNIYHRKNKNTFSLSKGHRYFRIIHKWLYYDKKKIFTKKILNHLTSEAIALWWMDDGTMSTDYRKSTGKITARKFVLSTFCSSEEADNIIEMFKTKWNINFYKLKRTMKDNSIKYCIQCRTKEGIKFSNLIRPYILKGFEYKILPIQEQEASYKQDEDIV